MIAAHQPVRAALLEDGHAVVGLLDRSQVASVDHLVDRLGIDPEVGFYASSVHASRHDATALRSDLLSIIDPTIRRALPGWRAVKAVALVKGSCGHNWVTPHQDWDYVDERHHRACIFWIPLQATSVADGLLHVVSGSHRWIDNRRGSGEIPDPFAPYHEELTALGTATEVDAGEAIVYDPAAIHYSPPNDGERARTAIGVVAVPEEAAVVHLRSTDGRQAGIYEVDPVFFTAEPFSTPPPGSPTDLVALGTTEVGRSQFDALVARRR